MNRDPLIEEIHQVRARLLAECHGDLNQLLDRYHDSHDGERGVTLKDVEEQRQRSQQRSLARH